MTVSVKAPTSTTGSIQLNGSDVLTIDSSGNLTVPNDVSVTGDVGIGTSSPAYPLHVVTSNAVAGKIQSDRSGGFAYFDVQNTSTTVAGSAAITRLITQNAAGTGTTSSDIYRLATGQFSINNNETSSAAFTSFAVGGTERMRIDSSGYITEPNKPMAFAISAPATSTSPGSPVVLKYANAAYNPSSHYNATTGLFTCPVAGRYKVTQHCMVDAGLTGYALSVSIRKNGGAVCTAYTANSSYNEMASAAIISCSASDTLAAYLDHGGKHAGYDSFTVEFLG